MSRAQGAPAAQQPPVAGQTGGLERFQRQLVSLVLFAADAAGAAVAVFSWCLWQRALFTGSRDLRLLLKEVTGSFSFGAPAELLQGGGITYTMQHLGQTRTVDAGLFALVLLTAFLLLLLAEALIRFAAGLIGDARVEQQMASLAKLTREAGELARADLAKAEQARQEAARALNANADRARQESARKLASLQNEISNLSPTSPGARIETKDADLRGLGQAVNDLVDRMNEGYRQQVRFVSDASHELRTPIAVIKGYADMLDRWGADDEKVLRESIEAIKTETDGMNRLVEQLLFLARGDSGRTQLKLETVSLTDLLREVYSECVMIDKQHAYSLSADDEVEAQGDEVLLKQTARILTDNAAKYTPAGGSILIKVCRDGAGAPRFLVEDSGIGIKAEDAPAVFDRFYRADAGREQNAKGTGLGLSIAKWIVDRHGGVFEVVSREGVGTRMAVTLPKPAAEDA